METNAIDFLNKDPVILLELFFVDFGIFIFMVFGYIPDFIYDN
jgi:hypothetical protein